MSFATRHKKGGVQWGVDTEGFEYFKLEDLYNMNGANQEYQLKGVFVNRNKSEKKQCIKKIVFTPCFRYVIKFKY